MQQDEVSADVLQQIESSQAMPMKPEVDDETVGVESQQNENCHASQAVVCESTQPAARDQQETIDKNVQNDGSEPGAVEDHERSQNRTDTSGMQPPSTQKVHSRGSRKLPSLANILQPPRSSPGTVDRATVLVNGVTITPSAPLSAVTAHHASGLPDKIAADENPGPSTAVLHTEALLPSSRTQPGSKTPSVSGNSSSRNLPTTTTRPLNTSTSASSPSTSPTTAANKALASTFISTALSGSSSTSRQNHHSHHHSKSKDSSHRSPKPRHDHDDLHHPTPNPVVSFPHPPVSRTQQKILLQRQQHFLTDDENSILHPQNHVHLTKESERISREYQCLRVFEDPMGDSVRRVTNARKSRNPSDFGTGSSSVRRQDPSSVQRGSVSPAFSNSPSGTNVLGPHNSPDLNAGTSNFFSRMIWGTRERTTVQIER